MRVKTRAAGSWQFWKNWKKQQSKKKKETSALGCKILTLQLKGLGFKPVIISSLFYCTLSAISYRTSNVLPKANELIEKKIRVILK